MEILRTVIIFTLLKIPLYTCNLISTVSYEVILLNNSTGLNCEYSHSEVTSLRGKSRMRCASKCSEHEECRAFLQDNSRCILIGDTSQLGDDVTDSQELSWPREYFLKSIGNCLNGVCYEFPEGETSWATAEQFCVDEYGGHLAEVTSCAIHDYIMTYLTGET